MFNNKLRPKTELEKSYDRALRKLDDLDVDSKEYGETLDRVAKLHKMKEEEKPSTISKDTLALIATNLLGILMIIKHERLEIITSKALPFVTNAKP